MAGRQDQIKDRMAAIREEQEDSLRRREELLKEIEMANQLTRRDQEQAEQAREERKEELEAQVFHFQFFNQFHSVNVAGTCLIEKFLRYKFCF